MAEKKEVTIKLTDEQRRQIKGTTGKDITELKFESVEDRANPAFRFEAVEDRSNPLSISAETERANPLAAAKFDERANPLSISAETERANPLAPMDPEEQ